VKFPQTFTSAQKARPDAFKAEALVANELHGRVTKWQSGHFEVFVCEKNICVTTMCMQGSYALNVEQN